MPGRTRFRAILDQIGLCEEALKIADLFDPDHMSVSQTGRDDACWRLLRAMRMKGQEKEAIKRAETFLREGKRGGGPFAQNNVTCEYSWLLRAAGRPDQALGAVEQADVSNASWGAKVCNLERVRNLAALERFDEAETLLRHIIASFVPGDETYSVVSAYGMLGVLQQRRGDEQGAIQCWKKVAESKWKSSFGGAALADCLVVKSLAGDVSVDDVDALIKVANGVPGADADGVVGAMINLVVQVVPKDRMARIWQDAFRSRAGREYARKLLFREMPFAEHIESVFAILLSAAVRQEAFAKGPSLDQDELVWQTLRNISSGCRGRQDGKIAARAIASVLGGRAGLCGLGLGRSVVPARPARQDRLYHGPPLSAARQARRRQDVFPGGTRRRPQRFLAPTPGPAGSRFVEKPRSGPDPPPRRFKCQRPRYKAKRH